eukprot:UN32216
MSRKRLEINLKKETKQLEKYANVNKKALDQYEHFSTTKRSTPKTTKRSREKQKAIRDLIDHLDRQKDEAIQRTYKAIASHFGQVFGELVEGGTGKFVLFKRQRSADDDEKGGRGTISFRSIYRNWNKSQFHRWS